MIPTTLNAQANAVALGNEFLMPASASEVRSGTIPRLTWPSYRTLQGYFADPTTPVAYACEYSNTEMLSYSPSFSPFSLEQQLLVPISE